MRRFDRSASFGLKSVSLCQDALACHDFWVDSNFLLASSAALGFPLTVTDAVDVFLPLIVHTANGFVEGFDGLAAGAVFKQKNAYIRRASTKNHKIFYITVNLYSI